MALQSPVLQLSAAPKSLTMKSMTRRISPSRSLHFQEGFVQFRKLASVPSLSPSFVYKCPLRLVPCALNISRGESGGPEEIWHAFLEKVRNMWEKIPGPVKDVPINMWKKTREPIKVFPWKKASERFFYHLFSLALWVAKWLFIPVLIVSSLSEITYCGWQNKELLIPFGMLTGGVLAGIFKETAIELSKDFQEGKYPWHLFIIGAFFTFIKFLGPYYPYWGRIFLPHFANGGLWTTLWFTNIWYKSQSKSNEVESNPGTNLK